MVRAIFNYYKNDSIITLNGKVKKMNERTTNLNKFNLIYLTFNYIIFCFLTVLFFPVVGVIILDA